MSPLETKLVAVLEDMRAVLGDERRRTKGTKGTRSLHCDAADELQKMIRYAMAEAMFYDQRRATS
jgi:hypothetical protein